jgi:hypothetical protein
VETVQAVDFGDSSPDLYRRAFRRLLCGLRQEPPGPNAPFEGALRLPQEESTDLRPLAASENTFLKEIFRQLELGQPVMILAQADTNTQMYNHAISQRAETLFGCDNVFHIFPPNSTRADRSAYFGRLARQCGFDDTVSESWEWAELLTQRLESRQQVFLLVSGFENGPDESRGELAGELRQLNEHYFARFHLIMMGSQRLAALKYAHGNMSLLNIAIEVPIPELAPEDLPEIFGQLYPDLQLTEKQLLEVLEFTGCHPRLLHFCLQQGANSAQTCKDLLNHSPLPTQLFTQFRKEHDRPFLNAYLKKTSLGKFDLWPTERLLRKLYWCNLITCRGSEFEWRCDYIRQICLEMLECQKSC